MIVPATLASMAIHCVQAHTRCMNGLSVKTEPLVSTFAIDAIRPNASNKTDRLEASSKRYRMPVSSFSIVVNCFMETVPFKSKKYPRNTVMLGWIDEQALYLVEEEYLR